MKRAGRVLNRTLMEKRRDRDILFMDIAARVAEESFAVRKQVGAVVVKNDHILAYGWNGMPAGMDNCCEYTLEDGTLKTRPEVIHAEVNALGKAAQSGDSTAGATLYVTLAPCTNCTSAIIAAGIVRVVYRDTYGMEGVEILHNCGIMVEQL